MHRNDVVVPCKKNARSLSSLSSSSSSSSSSSRKKKLIALREVRHMLDEVSARRTILCKENEEHARRISSMRQALASMPRAVQVERAKLLAYNKKANEELRLMVDATAMSTSFSTSTVTTANENIRESLYAMNLTSSSMPMIVATGSTASSLMQQQAFCSSLFAKSFPIGSDSDVAASANIPILPFVIGAGL